MFSQNPFLDITPNTNELVVASLSALGMSIPNKDQRMNELPEAAQNMDMEWGKRPPGWLSLVCNFF